MESPWSRVTDPAPTAFPAILYPLGSRRRLDQVVIVSDEAMWSAMALEALVVVLFLLI